MFSMKKCLLGLSLGAGILLTGCASNGGQPESAEAVPSSQAVMCSTCKVVYISVPTKVGKNIVGYHTESKMECPYCKDAVANFFTTGHLEANCPKCNGTMAICEQHGE